jgi:Rv2175c C-terminal domain of unknown function
VTSQTAAGAGDHDELGALVADWLTLPDVAERLRLDVGKVRRLLQEDELIAVRRGDPRVLRVPAAMLVDDELLAGLRGTVTVLADSGYRGEAAVRWLFTAEAGEPAPIELLRSGHKSEVRRRAQALAF